MKRRLRSKLSAIFLFLFLGGAAFGQQTVQPKPTPPPDEPEDEILRVNTELIFIPTVVTDRAGKPVGNLQAKNFVVFEDGKPQDIESFVTTEKPFEIALLLDTSGSTRGELALIQKAAEAFIKALRPGDKVAIIAFKSAVVDGQREAVVDILTNLTDDRAALSEAVAKAKTSNGTPFYEALEAIADKIFTNKATDEQRGRRAIVALTDGVDSTSAIEFEDARERIADADLACYFVQVNTEDFVEERVLGNCEDDTALRFSRVQLRRYQKMLKPRPGGTKPPMEDFCSLGQFERLAVSRALYKMARFEMESLAKNTGGKTFPVAELREARNAFAQVAQEIGTQYSIGYYSSNEKRDGAYRKIRVEPRGLPAGTQIKAREGYYAGKD
jgi:Ca-activated chloride channel homolog